MASSKNRRGGSGKDRGARTEAEDTAPGSTDPRAEETAADRPDEASGVQRDPATDTTSEATRPDPADAPAPDDTPTDDGAREPVAAEATQPDPADAPAPDDTPTDDGAREPVAAEAMPERFAEAEQTSDPAHPADPGNAPEVPDPLAAEAEAGRGDDMADAAHPLDATDTAQPETATEGASGTEPGDQPAAGDAQAEEARGGDDSAAALAAGGAMAGAAATAAATADPAPRRDPPQPEPKRGGAMPLVMGGVLAGAIGFGVAWYLEREGIFFGSRDAVAALDADLTGLQGRLDGLQTALDGLAADIPAEAAAVAEATARDAAAESTAAFADRLTALEQSLTDQVGDVVARMDAIERLPFDGAEAAAVAVESYQRELAGLRAELDAVSDRTETLIAELEAERAEREARLAEAEAELAAIAAEAAATERGAEARAALRQLQEAFASGVPYGSVLDRLAALEIEVAPALSAHGEAGVPTMLDLQQRFPPAARTALSEALSDTADLPLTDRLLAFFRNQIGARSLEARPGDDPDAVLSRAEAAVRSADLATALQELAALPDGPRAHLSGWAADAETRLAADAALADLASLIDTL